MSEYEVLPNSDKFKELCRIKFDFPWDTIKVGESFKVPKNVIKFGTLKPKASIAGKKLNKKFKVVEHFDCYEVGRLS